MLNTKAFISDKNIKKTRELLMAILKLLILLAIGYIIIYPLLQMLVTSVKSKSALFNPANVWLPADFDIKYNYSIAADVLNYGSSLISTLSLQVVSALIEVFSCAIAAYGFARFRFKFKNILLIGLFLTILIPETMIIIPRVVNYSNMDFLGFLGLFNKITGIDIRPNILNSPLAFWLPSLFAMGLRS